jgi:pimeloyl-ACP methyl ester carboxylesterase
VDFDYAVAPGLVVLVGAVAIGMSVGRMRALAESGCSQRRRLEERIVLAGGVLLAAAVAGSAGFNAVADLWFRVRHPAEGQIEWVDGYRMHINCVGSGSPALVLEAGLGSGTLSWAAVQPALARTTRVCSYDRAGFGLSDTRPGPRDADHIAVELHELLMRAGVTGPIVLEGQSIGGIYMRDYASRYGSDVAGMVFLDGSTPMQQENPALKAAGEGQPQRMRLLVRRVGSILGIPRLLGLCSQPTGGTVSYVEGMQREDRCHEQVAAMIAETDSLRQSGEETVQSGPYGALPILVISHDPAVALARANSAQTAADAERAWDGMQEGMKKLSTRGRRIIAKGSTHFVLSDRPDLIEREVPAFVEEVSGRAAPTTEYGSTVTE